MSNDAPPVATFEIDSVHVGARFSVTVTLPPGYAAMDECPVLYVTDGNSNGPLAASQGMSLVGDPLQPLHPFILVAVGHAVADDNRSLILRNRDFIPPGEPFPDVLEGYIDLLVQAQMFSTDDLEEFLNNARDGHADAFLRFLEEEVHPEVQRRYRVAERGTGLFGSSYGGLFTLYALAAGSELFDKYGASSPGILVDESRVFALYDELVARDDPERNLFLHVAINDMEMFGVVELYRRLGAGTLRFVDRVRKNPLPGLSLRTHVVIGENHGTGVVDAYRDFVRHAYAIHDYRPPLSQQHPVTFVLS